MDEVLKIILNNSIIVIVSLFISSMVLQKYLIAYPNELLPITNGVLGSILLTICLSINNPHIQVGFTLLFGFILGLSSVGLHQLITKTRRYFILKRFTKLRELQRRRK